jgi:hypothetical protein
MANDVKPYEEVVHLSPRSEAGPPRETDQDQPYIVGPVVLEPGRFYGMKSILDQLKAHVDLVAGPAHADGAHVFVHGPKRTGKTSAVRLFLSSLDDTPRSSILTVYLSAVSGESWTGFRKRLRTEFLSAASTRAAAAGLPFELPSGRRLSLVQLIELVRDQLTCSIVVAIDEAMKLLHAGSRAHGRDALLRFALLTRQLAHVLIIWIGPTASLRRLGAMQEVLQAATHRRMPPLEDKEVYALLRVEKMAPRCRVHVEQSVVAKVYALTGGNPFWVSRLGSAMWERAERRTFGLRIYDDPTLQRAVADVIHDSITFSDRYQAPDDADADSRLVMSTVLMELATVPANGGLEREELRTAVARRLPGHPVDSVLNGIIEDLQDRGTIEPVGRTHWRICAPILADHLQWKSGGRPSWLL